VPILPSLSDDIKINWITLSFPKDLEKTFLEQYFHDSLRQVRIALTLGIFFYGVFGILDAWLVPDAKLQLWFIRFVVICPFLCANFLFTYSRQFKKYIQLSISSTVLAGGFGIIAMIVIAPYPANYSYYAGLLLAFMYGSDACRPVSRISKTAFLPGILPVARSVSLFKILVSIGLMDFLCIIQ
jgi:hypothetical protein